MVDFGILTCDTIIINLREMNKFVTKIKKKQLEKRKVIIEKAANLMNDVGIENLTIRMICDAAEISSGTLYHYFDNKSDLVTQLFALIDDYFQENIVNRLDHEDELMNIIRYCEGFAEYVTLCGVARSKLISSVFPNYINRGAYDERKRILNKELCKIIRRGQAKGQITIDYSSDKLVDMILVMVRGYSFDWGRRGGSYDLIERTEEMVSLFVIGLRPIAQTR